MKYLQFVLVAVMMFAMSACSGSKSYSPEKCQQLSELAKSGTELTSSDYNEMIDQLVAVAKILDEKKTEIGDDKAKLMEFMTSEEGGQLMEYAIGFAMYLEQHQKDLSADNLKKMVEAKEELEMLNK